MLIALVSLMAMSTPLLLEPSSVEEPVFPGDGITYPGGEHVHDPTIIEFGGRFVCFSTSGGGFASVRSSPDMKEWTDHGAIFREHPQWLRERYRHRSIWAPDILVLGKKLRMYYCASNWGTNESVIGLAECEAFDPAKPTEGWKDLGLVMQSRPNEETYNCIDPETIVDQQGRHWMIFGSYFAGIYAVELDPSSGKLKEPEKPNLVQVARNTGERGNPLEGAAVCRRGEYYYLFVSYGLAGQGVRSTYRIMVGRSKEVAGPYVDRAGRLMTEGGHVEVLKTSPPMFSPGHCDVFQTRKGQFLMPYHYYDGRKFWRGDVWGRPALQIRELLWSEDGWPLPGMPVGWNAPGPHTNLAGKWLHQPDFGQPFEVTLEADGTIGGGRDPGGRWEKKGDTLVLNWPRRDEPGQFWTDAVQVAYEGNYYVGRNQSGAVIRGVRIEEAGR